MALKKKGKWWHGTQAADLDQFLLRHVLGRLCRGVEHRVIHACCAKCKAAAFDLFIDDQSRILRVCTACQAEHKVCDLDRKFVDKQAGEIVCTCMYSECEVAVGFALMNPEPGKDEGPIAYLYVAGRCTHCGLCGVYGEWSPDGDFAFKKMAKTV